MILFISFEDHVLECATLYSERMVGIVMNQRYDYADGRVTVYCPQSAVDIPLPDESVHCVMTSPPYWGLRLYKGIEPSVWGGDKDCQHKWGEETYTQRSGGTDSSTLGELSGGNAMSPEARNRAITNSFVEASQGQFCQHCNAWRGMLGLEPTPDLYVEHMVQVFREVRRVLRNDGTLWLNLGDSYAASRGYQVPDGIHVDVGNSKASEVPSGLKPKDLIGIPWKVAFALQADGWWLRSDIIWAKGLSFIEEYSGSVMPESVRDRPTKAHEYLFLLTKSQRYYYDQEAVREASQSGPSDVHKMISGEQRIGGKHKELDDPLSKASRSTNIGQKRGVGDPSGRNLRDVWAINPQAYPEAHFACVDQETECLTAEGWKRYDELEIGELAAQYDMESETLSWAPIEDIATYDVQDQEMVVARNRDLKLMLTPNHRCVIKRRHPKTRQYQPPVIVQADQLKPSHSIPTAGEWNQEGDSTLPLEWAELLGWYISEGYESKNTPAIEIYQSQTANPFRVERIKQLLQQVGAEWTSATYEREWRGRPSVQVTFRVIGYAAARLRELSPKKSIPKGVLLWSTDRIEALMIGLIGGDGNYRDDGRASFIQKNKDTIDMVQALAIRLGWSASVSPRMAPGELWTVYFTTHRTRSFRGTHGQGSPPGRELYSGVVWCPKLPNGTWMARRQGRPFITGNTYPEALVEPCIKAGTSEKGCCPLCLAPWERLFSTRGDNPEQAPGTNEKTWSNPDNPFSESIGGGGQRQKWLDEHPIRTIGWKPTCDHTEEPIPCTVLDPFAGSGTTLKVALNLDRDSVGIELNEDYLQYIEKRLRSHDPKLHEKHSIKEAQESGIKTLVEFP